jgi:hypothetical protein
VLEISRSAIYRGRYAASRTPLELNAQAGGEGGQGEDRIDGAAAGGHLKTAMNKIARKS